MIHYYCSIASSDYKYKVLALYNSMVKHDKEFNFFIICMGDEALASFAALKLENTVLIPVSAIESYYPELTKARKDRNDKEYAWTVKPSAFLYIFNNYNYIDHIMWLDGDTMFLSDPGPIYLEWGRHSILLTEERYTGKHAHLSRIYGIYNTGLLGFRRDANSFECLKWFQSKVNEWCYDRMENGLWSDQMYVNDWPERFKGVAVIKNAGINMTPFILWRFTAEEKRHIDARRLVLFHYYGFRYAGTDDYDLCTYKDWGFPEAVVRSIYMPYISACEAALLQLKRGNAEETEQIPETGAAEDKHNSQYCFCTLTTLEYLPKCLALLDSIESNTDSFHIWICCMEDAAYDILTGMGLENVTLVRVSEMEDNKLRAVKKNRKDYEYCWTLKAPFMLHIFEKYENVASLLYLDADIYLFSRPDRCFKALERHTVLLTHHNFSQPYKHLYRKKGRFNAGIIGFKRCGTALSYLKWWRKKCIEWCFDVVSEGRFADQKYLENFLKPYGSAYLEENIGMNAAVWNLEDKEVHCRGEDIFIGGDLLVFYHFSSFMILGENEFDLWKWDSLKVSGSAKELIYFPYARAVAESIKKIKPYINEISKVYSGMNAWYRASNSAIIENLD